MVLTQTNYPEQFFSLSNSQVSWKYVQKTKKKKTHTSLPLSLKFVLNPWSLSLAYNKVSLSPSGIRNPEKGKALYQMSFNYK